jgi:hypothetical protein
MTQQLAGICIFCGSTNVLVEDSQRILEQPDGLLPFYIGKEQAQNAFAQRLVSWLSGTRQTARNLWGIYVPFWVFDGIVEAYTFSTDWATASKKTLGLSTHENLLLPGVDAPSPGAQQAVFPFRLETLIPYEPRLLADWPARRAKQPSARCQGGVSDEPADAVYSCPCSKAAVVSNRWPRP